MSYTKSEGSVSLIELQKEVDSLRFQAKIHEQVLKMFTNDLIESVALVRSLITLLEANDIIDTEVLDHFVEEQKVRLIQELTNPALKEERA